jgi:hypothetical protein
MTQIPIKNAYKWFYELYYFGGFFSNRTHHENGVSNYETLRHYSKEGSFSKIVNGEYPKGYTSHFSTRGNHKAKEPFFLEGIEIIWDANQFDMESDKFSLPFGKHGLFKLDNEDSIWKHEIHHKNESIEARRNEEYLMCFHNSHRTATMHSLTKNGTGEGIEIKWEGDPFKMRFNDHLIEYYREY